MVRVWCCVVEAISGIVLKLDNGVDDSVVACGCFVVVDSGVACIVSWVDVVGTREDVVALILNEKKVVTVWYVLLLKQMFVHTLTTCSYDALWIVKEFRKNANHVGNSNIF